MKKIVPVLLLLLINITFSQNKEAAEKLVDEGINYHDKGDYEGAIVRYDQALALDQDNLEALGEKAFSLLSLEKYDDAISYCQKAIEKHPKENNLKSVYVTYGNALDELKKTDRALSVYEEGIAKFPDYYQLYFNQGVTYSSVKKYDEALTSFQRAVKLNPKHASSNNGIARLEDLNNRKIPAILAYCRFFVIEPQSDRAKKNLESLKELMTANVKKTGDNSVTVTIDPESLYSGSKKGKAKENDFSSTELISTLDVAQDYDDKNKDKTDVEKFIRKFETICASLDENKKNKSGFYWEVYVPYFLDMKKNNLITTFGYIAYASSETQDVTDWLKNNSKELDRFYEWSKNYNWNTK